MKVTTVRALYEQERERLKVLWARTNPELILKDGTLLMDAEAQVAADVVDSLLDATVLLPDECPDCGGTGDAHYRDDPPTHMPSCDTCPTCHGKRPAVIVPKEQWEAAVNALDTVLGRVANTEELAAIATALLGGKVYRATEVGTLRIDTEGRAYVWNDVDGDQPIADHSTIAILEEAHGKEEE